MKVEMLGLMMTRVLLGIRTILVVFILLVSLPGAVFASPDPLIFGRYDECAVDQGELDAGTTSNGETAQITLPASLPEETIAYLDGRNVKNLYTQNLERYQYAEQQTGVPAAAIAALHYREAGMASDRSITNGARLGSGTNVDGVTVGTTPNGDAEIAAGIFKRNAKGVYGVDVTKQSLSTSEWGEAFLAYNRGSLYKNAGWTYLVSPYVMNGYDEDHMNMHWPGRPGDIAPSLFSKPADGNLAGALAVLVYLGGLNITTVTTSGGCTGSDGSTAGGIGISSDGFVFPLQTTKSAIRAGSKNSSFATGIWCYTAQTNCHGSYTAADIHVNTNTPVLAAVGGEITAMSGSVLDNNGLNMSIHNSGTGVTYFYTHMGRYANVSVGQTVTAGTTIGFVGTSGQAQGTAPHLHIDAGTGYQVRPSCSRASGCPIADDLIDLQPFLVKAFENVPE